MIATTVEGKQIVDILDQLTPANGENVVTLFDASYLDIDANILAQASSISICCHLRDLRATYRVNSLEPAPLPQFELTDTDDEKILKASFAQ